MIVKNHNIELKDTSASEMARFRQIMLSIWRQQIEDEKNTQEMGKLFTRNYSTANTSDTKHLNEPITDEKFALDSIRGTTNRENIRQNRNSVEFRQISILPHKNSKIDPKKGKLTGSKNLVIFTAENGIDQNKMNKNSGQYDWIAVKNPLDAENILKSYYGDKKRFVENLVWRSHGETGAALLDVSPKITFSDPSKVKSFYYIKDLLTDDANVVFTACSLVGESLQPGKRYHKQGRNALDKFSDFFVKGSQRNLFLNYTLSSATDQTYNSFNFNVGLHKQNWAGFLWLTKDEIKPYFYDVKINSSGGINTQQLKWFMDFSHNKKPLYKN